MSVVDQSRVLGVVLLARHGDREGFYQDAKTYTPSNTAITPLGNQQEYQLGQLIRSIYLDPSSPDFIAGVDTALANRAQIRVRADAGGEGGVIFNSALAMLQGLYPATTQYNTTLANGTTIFGPLNGYQTIPIESVESENDISLEGFVQCNSLSASTQAFYNSPAFADKAEQHAAFLQQLPRYLNGRPATLQNIWNVFDLMNVQSIHNATFAAQLPTTFLSQARDLANWHAYNTFSSPQLAGIGNIAGRTVLPSILKGFESITNSNDKDSLKILYQAISYKPFLSLFNMTGAAEITPELAGIVNYAAAVAFEVRQPLEGGAPFLRFKFKNGTADANFKTYGFLGSSKDVPISTFVNRLASAAVNDTPTWCSVCNNNVDRGCGALAIAEARGAASVQSSISPVGAGFLGAGVSLAVALLMFGMLVFLGVLTFEKKRPKLVRKGTVSDDGSYVGSQLKV